MFSSHFHEDHFTKEIFKWKNNIPNITYILSKDILKRRRAQKEDADVWMVKGTVWEDEYLKVTATGRKRTEQREQKPSWLGLCRVASDEGEANDSGVSWIVETEGRTIFHAGDLCNWYARFLDDNTPEEEVFSEEFGQYINPVAEEKQFLGELKDIRKITDSFDLVMFPVDGRIGNGYTLGGRQFIEPTTSREQYQARLIIAEARRRKTKSTLQGWNVCPDALCHEWI